MRCATLKLSPWPTHLRLEFGTELVQGRTAPRRCTSLYCSALRLEVWVSARIVLQPAKPPINRSLHVRRIRVCQMAYHRGVHDISDPLRPQGGCPMWSARGTEEILFVHHCVHVLYHCSGRPVMCYLRVFLNLVAVFRVDLPILGPASHPINVPMPLLTQPRPDDHVPGTSRPIHCSSALVLCQAYTIGTFWIGPCQCGWLGTCFCTSIIGIMGGWVLPGP